MNREYLLSICMMVKDEEKNVRRCLDALKPLLDKPDIELIIVDTGSQDNTVSITQEYTKKVFHHKWDRNFSHMRNITISYAKGEFIFILDADEVLLEPLKLYSILSNRSGSFNTYNLIIRNLLETGNPSLLPHPRVFRNDGDFRYEGAVHNQPVFKEPIMTTDLFIDHYGYLFIDDELREKKFLRTASILLNELEKDPKNVYYRFQLSKSYFAHRENRKALSEIRKAYQLIYEDEGLKKDHCYVYGMYASMCCKNNEFNEAVDVCLDGLKAIPDYTDLYYMLAFAYINLDKRIEAYNAYVKYVDMVERFSELSVSSNFSIDMMYTNTSDLDDAAFFIAKEAFNRTDYEEAYNYLKRVASIQTKIELLIKVLLKLEKSDELKQTYLEHCKDEQTNKKIIMTIEKERALYTQNEKNELAMLFSTEDGLYPLLNKGRTGSVAGNELLGDIAVREADFNELPGFYAELFLDIDKSTRQTISILKKLKKSKLKEYIRILIDNGKELKGFFESFILAGSIRDDFQSLKIGIGISYVLLINKAIILKNTESEPSEQDYSLFKQYISYGVKYVLFMYDTQKLRIYFSTLEDQEDCFFIGLHYATQAIEKGEDKAAIRYFRGAAIANPYMAIYMKEYMNELFPNTSVSVREDEADE